VASAVASFTVSKIWGPGTLFSAAATPIIVALVSELVRRPVRQVSTIPQKVAPLRYRPPPGSATAPAPHPAGPLDETLHQPPAVADETSPAARHPPPPGRPSPSASTTAGAPWEEPRAPASADDDRRGGPRWRLVLATGLLACLIVVGLFTALNVLAGQSLGSNSSPLVSIAPPPKASTPATSTTPTTPTIGASGATGTSGTTGPTTTTTTTPATAAPLTGTSTGTTGATTGPTGVTGATGTSTTLTTPGTPATAPGAP
jgi:hypothetical protein